MRYQYAKLGMQLMFFLSFLRRNKTMLLFSYQLQMIVSLGMSEAISWLTVTRVLSIADWLDLWICYRIYSHWIQDACTRLAVNLLHA